MLTERVKQQFNDSIQTTITAADTLVEPVSQAGAVLSDVILANQKVLVCGNGRSFADAQRFCAALMYRYRASRPSFPTILLGANDVMTSAILAEGDYQDVFSRPLKALGQAGDVLLLVTTSAQEKCILDVVEAAKQRDMRLIMLTGGDDSTVLAPLLEEQDIQICVPSQDMFRVQEVHVLLLHCLCDLIDTQLFQTEA